MEKSNKSSYTKSCHSKPGHYLLPRPVMSQYGVLESFTQVVYKRQQASKILDRVQDDYMITTARAFTLIELLIVVLIIGILVAVAVPQYRKVVRRNHLIQFQIEARSIFQSLNMYRLANGEPHDLRDLDVWDSVSADKEEGFLNGRKHFRNPGGAYFRTYVHIPGIKDNASCDFWFFNWNGKSGPWGSCHANNDDWKQLFESLNWKPNGTTQYYIPKTGF